MNFKSWAPLGAIALAIASMTSAHAADKSVAVTAIVEHPALDAVRDGVQAALAVEDHGIGHLLGQVVAAMLGDQMQAQVEPGMRAAGAEQVAVLRTPLDQFHATCMTKSTLDA